MEVWGSCTGALAAWAERTTPRTRPASHHTTISLRDVLCNLPQSSVKPQSRKRFYHRLNRPPSGEALTRAPGLLRKLLRDGIAAAHPEGLGGDFERGRRLLALIFGAVDPADGFPHEVRIETVLGDDFLR